MRVPPKGTRLREAAEFDVRVRQLRRALERDMLAPFTAWLSRILEKFA